MTSNQDKGENEKGTWGLFNKHIRIGAFFVPSHSPQPSLGGTLGPSKDKAGLISRKEGTSVLVERLHRGQ